MVEVLVKGLHAHAANSLGNQVANRVTRHGAADASPHAECIGEIGGDVELAAADMDGALVRLAKRDDTGVQTVDQCAERQEVEGAVSFDVQ